MSSVVLEPAREVPILHHPDVIVCGGGPSGFIAAIAAARSGARVLLVEKHGFLGGMATAALVGPISKFRFGGERVVSGLPWEFVQRLEREGGARSDLPSGNIPFDAELYKMVALDMAREAGVEMLFHTRVAGCIAEPNEPGRLTHVLLEGSMGRFAVAARYAIDCTGTGDLVARTLLPSKMRSDDSGKLQPMSLCFRLGGVDTENLTVWMAEDGVKYRNFTLADHLQEKVQSGVLGKFGGPWAVWGSTLRPGEVSVNATRYQGNAADPHAISDAEVQLRGEIPHIIEAFRHEPQFRDCYLLEVATQVGIRETRTVEGLYTLEVDDVLNPKDFPDTVAFGAHPIDVHRATDSGTDATFLKRAYNVPFRCLVPRGSQNVLVAGGCLSATHEAFASVRVQAQCMALGEAAGTAAALCLSQNRGVAELNGALLRQTLRENGAIVERP